jgi:hypothetical protein
MPVTFTGCKLEAGEAADASCADDPGFQAMEIPVPRCRHSAEEIFQLIKYTPQFPAGCNLFCPSPDMMHEQKDLLSDYSDGRASQQKSPGGALLCKVRLNVSKSCLFQCMR